ncbi:phosphoribosylformylglycinamidine synthase I [Candidatus Roizmanbacteria bacterium CG09_land_8_20_14_0_10_41_9]|uniref:Phosphoribosylformylglycinamidine synthase I n=1 Tax=Candidatus Roizmanbacteria bacterium CG09_land_8_20_14_0_10_41_9 TaxID=1974850 RepID=A0A2H0WTI5_9BACT|nr:MAG: phosphoribosylformylglycinamidine synthase I [Candidatus Roizmanbacteria bacterium CG09_land_8_20_14_0_10_41_9]
MAKPNVIVLSGYGLNCEEETKFAFELSGSKAEIIHINDLIQKPSIFDKYQIMAVPGGFAYGDDTGSGNAYANKLKNHLWEKIENFVRKDRLVIGICNGFQILVNLGLLPAFDKNYGNRQVALLHNNSARYTVRWVDLKIENNTPWFAHIKTISLPIAHGEGRFFATSEILSKLKKKKLVAARYVKREICTYQSLPANPNGALDGIAAITDESGRILGMMPHPERAIFFTHLPHWPLLKEQYLRNKKSLPKFGPGLQIFKNAVSYFL